MKKEINKHRKCTDCGKKATRQTVRGNENESAGGLPQNDGYYCQKCWDIGDKLEKEAIYGNCRYECKC